MSERGWDQADLAHAANVNKTQVTRWLGEGVTPSVDIHHFSDVELLAEIRRRLIVASRLRTLSLVNDQLDVGGEQQGTDEIEFDTSTTRPIVDAEDEAAGYPGAQD